VDESESVKAIFRLADDLNKEGVSVALVLHPQSLNTPGLVDQIKLIRTGFIPTEAEVALLKSAGFSENSEELKRFIGDTQGVPTAYVGLMKPVAGAMKYVDLVAQAQNMIQRSYEVAKRTNPGVADILAKLADGKLSTSDIQGIQRVALLDTGLVGEKDAKTGGELVMPSLVSDVVNLIEFREKVRGLPGEYTDYLEGAHFNAYFHHEGGAQAKLKHHLLAILAALRTAANDERVPKAARNYVQDWASKDKAMIEAFIIVIKNHVFAFGVKSADDFTTLSKEFESAGIVGKDFEKAMEYLIATTTLDLMGSQSDDQGNTDPWVNAVANGFSGDTTDTLTVDANTVAGNVYVRVIVSDDSGLYGSNTSSDALLTVE